MNPNDIAPRLGQVPGRLAAPSPASVGLSAPARAGRSHAGRVVHALPASLRAGACVRSQLVAPSPPAARELSQRLRAGDPAAH